MRSFFAFLICFLVPASFFAQELSENLESYQVTVADQQIIVSGYKPLSKGAVFETYQCDKNLAVLNHYTKTLPVPTSSFYVGKSGGLFVFTFYGTGEKEKYRIALDANFIEKYAAEPQPKQKKTAADDNTMTTSDWVYDGSYCNDIIIGDLLLDAQMQAITCYSLTDPIQGVYKAKWEKDFDDVKYVKMEMLGTNDRTAYFLAVQSVPQNIQKLFAINIDDGTVLFSTELNESDSLDAVSVSSFVVKGDILYLAGTYVLDEPNQNFVPSYIDNSDYQKRGFDNDSPYIIAPADGYYLMTMDVKKGAILKMKTFGFPDVDKTVDYRDYRMAICHGITTLADGKMLAFFEMISSPHKEGVGSGSGFIVGGSSMSIYNEQVDPNSVKWETDAFTSVIFDAGMSDFNPTTMIWEETSSDYTLYDYDLFSLAPMQEVPHDFCTLGDEGAYPQNFVCDGTKWIYHVHGGDEKMPDYLIEVTETDAKSIKLLPPGLLLLRDNKSGIQVKESGQSIKVKIFAVE